jgi:competence protein ComEC
MRSAFLSTLILAITLFSPAPSPALAEAGPDPLFQVAFIDVGQGDAILIRDGAGFDVLVDGGRPSSGSRVLDYLRQAGVDDLEALVATHADQDHIGGLIEVLDAPDIPVEAAFYNGYPGDTQRWLEFTAAVTGEGLELVPAQSPQSFSWGRMGVQVLNPPPGQPKPEQNDASVVLLLDFGEVEVLLTGDIEDRVEADLLESGAPLAAEVLKVAHHGSSSSSNAGFLSAVDPAAAIISTGKNPYGHPASAVLQRLGETGAEIFRTDFLGTILLTSDGTGYTLSPRPVFLPVILGIR